jgi:hypothetical protein
MALKKGAQRPMILNNGAIVLSSSLEIINLKPKPFSAPFNDARNKTLSLT